MSLICFFGFYPVSKNQFYIVIRDFYLKRDCSIIPKAVLTKIISRITEKEYDFYRSNFWKYQKSRKRYSKYDIEDLEHPFVKFLILESFKELTPDSYINNCRVMLDFTQKEVECLEVEYDDYYDMF